MYALPPADNDWLIELGQAIEEANNAHNACDAQAPIAEHLAIDRALQVAVNQLENRLNPADYAKNQTIQDALGLIRTSIADSLRQAGVSLQLDGEPKTPLSQILSQLPELQAQRLMDALFIEDAQERDQALKIIFDPPDISAPALECQRYFELHSLGQRLGANSISYKISSAIDPPEVLKVEYRLGNSRHMDSIVRASLPDLVTPIAASRLLVGPGIPSQGIAHIGRTLMVTTFCDESGAREYANRLRDEAALRPPEDTTFFSQTLEIAKQMSAAFQAMEHNNLYFPDGKLSNWLVDSEANGAPKLRIADTKSFLRCAPYDRAHLHSEKDNVGAKIIATPGYCYDEAIANNTQAQYIHAGIFGRNIYKFLTGVTPDDTAPIDYSDPIFMTPSGSLFAQLIQDLTQVPAHKRPTVKQVTPLLKIIESMLDPRYDSLQIRADPRYALLKDKKRELKSLLGPSASNYFNSTLLKIYKEQEFDLDRIFTAANASLDTILPLVKSTIARHQLINTPEITFDGKPLFPNTLLMDDLEACIKNTYDLNSLAESLTDHNTRLQYLETHIHSIRELEGLLSTCKDQGFGPGDTEMEEFLTTVSVDILLSNSLKGRYADVMDIYSRLTAVTNQTEGSLIQKIRLEIQGLPNKQGIEAEAIKALQEAAIQVPVEFRADLLSHQGNKEVSELTNALARLEMIRDPAFNGIVEKLKQLNILTTPLDNSERLFKSLVALSEQSDESEAEEIIQDLNALMDNALTLAVHTEELQNAIKTMPTVYFEGKPAFPGDLLNTDKLKAIENTQTLSTLIDGFTQHMTNLTELKDLENARLPEQLKDLVAYIQSKRISSNDHTMDTFLDNAVGTIFEQEDLNERIVMFKRVTQGLDGLRQSFEKPENIELQKHIAEKISQPGEEAATIRALAIAVPVHKRFMAYKNEPEMHKLLAVLEGEELDVTQQPLNIRI